MDAEVLFPHFDGYASGNGILQSDRPTAETEDGAGARIVTGAGALSMTETAEGTGEGRKLNEYF